MNDTPLDFTEAHEAKAALDDRPDAWLTVPGASMAALSPANPDLVKTLPTADISVYRRRLPSFPGQVKNFNATYLEVTSRFKRDKLGMLLIGILGAILFLCVPVLLWWMHEVEAIAEEFFIVAPLMLLMWFGTTTFLPALTLALFTCADEPVRFCRTSRKVYIYSEAWRTWGGMGVYRFGKPEIRMYDWSQCRAEVAYKKHPNFEKAEDYALELAFLNPLTCRVIERLVVGKYLFSGPDTKVLLWETIRRYMEEGPENIAPPVFEARRETLADHIEAVNPFSLPARATTTAGRVLAYPAAVVCYVLLVPLAPFVFVSWALRKRERRHDWGELSQTVFRIAADDPALQRSRHPEQFIPRPAPEEGARRRRATRMWLGSLALQLGGFAAFVVYMKFFRY